MTARYSLGSKRRSPQPQATGAKLRFELVVPTDLRRKVEAAADASGLSMTYEIVNRLERSFIADEVAEAIRTEFRALPDMILDGIVGAKMVDV